MPRVLSGEAEERRRQDPSQQCRLHGDMRTTYANILGGPEQGATASSDAADNADEHESDSDHGDVEV